MFGRSIHLFRLFGIDVKLDPSWFLIAILVAWSLATQAFPAYLPGETPATYWIMGIAGALLFFASILAHEFGHALMAQRRGLPMRGITLFIFGGVAEMSREPDSALDEFLVAIAGPLVSVAIGVGCLAADWFLPMPPEVGVVVGYVGLINLVLVVFNMIPAFPLDGGRVLRSILWAVKGDLRWASRIASHIGGFFGLALIALGVARAIVWGDYLGAMWSVLIGLFLRNAAKQSYRQVVVRETLQGQPVRALMDESPQAIDFAYDTPAEEGDSIPAEADASQALTQMATTGRSHLVVTEGDRAIGVITARDLMRHIEQMRRRGRAEPA